MPPRPLPSLTIPPIYFRLFPQDYCDRTIVAERKIRVLEEVREKAEIRRALESPCRDATPVLPRTTSVSSPESMLEALLRQVNDAPPTASVQAFCATVLRKVADPVSGKGTLSRKR